MKYALFVYARDETPGETPQARHDPAVYTALHASGAVVLAHYRMRPARLATTLRCAGAEVVQSPGPLGDRQETLRALFLVEGDDEQAVIDIAAQLPALRGGGSAELWPLTEPNSSERHRRH
jgi:hypothetical protein